MFKLFGSNDEPSANVEEVRAFSHWSSRLYAPPAPRSVKTATVIRHYIPGSTWVETGTYLGETTLEMSTIAKEIISIEPEPELFRKAKLKLSAIPNITLINGSSEEVFLDVVAGISGPAATFWLDGHWSAGNTYLGEKVSPISFELSVLSEKITHFEFVSVAVDDVRCFNQSEFGFPGIDFLVDWARQHGLDWIIEHDIFVAKSHTLTWIPLSE